MPKTFVEKVSDIFIEQGLASEKEASAMRRSFKESGKEQFVDFLLEEGLMQAVDILHALSIYYEVPAIDVTDTFFERRLLQEFPKDFLLRHRVIPLQTEQDILFVVASNPAQDGLESDLRSFVSYDIEFYVGIGLDITDAIKEFYDESVAEEDEDEDIKEEQNRQKEEERIGSDFSDDEEE